MIAFILALALFAFPAEARNKLVVNGSTGQVQSVPLTVQEEAEADARDASPVIPPTPAATAARTIQETLALKAIVRVLAKKFNLTEQQLLDAIAAELP